MGLLSEILPRSNTNLNKISGRYKNNEIMKILFTCRYFRVFWFSNSEISFKRPLPMLKFNMIQPSFSAISATLF